MSLPPPDSNPSMTAGKAAAVRAAGGGGDARTDRDWKTIRLWQIQWVRDLLLIAVVVGVFNLGYRLSVVTVPMLVAMLLAYLFEPLVQRLTPPRGRFFSRPGVAVLIILGSILAFVVPVSIGLTVAVVQGVQYAGDVARNVGLVQDAVKHPKDAARLQQVPPGAWHWIADRLIQLDEQTAAGADGTGTGTPADNGQAGEGRGGGGGATPAGPNLGAPGNSGAHNAPSTGDSFAKSAGAPPEPLRGPDSKVAVDADGREQATRPDTQEEPSQAPSAVQAVPITGTTLRTTPTDADPKTGGIMGAADLALSWVRTNMGAIGRRAIGTGADAVGFAFRGAASLGSIIFGAFLTAFFFFFFCTGWGRVLAFWQSLIPERRKGRTIELIEKMDRVIAGFVRGRLTIALILAGVLTTLYWLIGVPMPLVIGPLVGALVLVPFGQTIGLPIAMLALWLQPSSVPWQQHWWWIVFAPVGVFLIGQAMDDYVLNPMISGKNTDMDTPTILFASLAGGALAGVYGLLLAIPVAACFKILLKEVFWPRFKAWGQGRERDFLPISREDAGV